PLLIVVASIFEPVRKQLELCVVRCPPPGMLWLDHEMRPQVASCAGLVFGDHHLVQLLAGPLSNNPELCLRRNSSGYLENPHARQLRDKYVAATELLDPGANEVSGLWQRNPEPGHAVIGDAQDTFRSLVQKGRHNA